MNPKHTFKRPCRRCLEIYRPDTKYQKYCKGCRKKTYMRYKNKNYCTNCGVLSFGEHRIAISKNYQPPFCSHCWTILENIDINELGRILKINTIIT